MTPLEIIASHAKEGAIAREKFFRESAAAIGDAAFLLALTLARGHKILLCGNGGSAADCQHMAAELVNRFIIERPALPAIALTTDTSALTAIGNDHAYAMIFARQVEALGREGDALVAISTSGNSENVLAAIEQGRAQKMTIIGLTGQGGGKMAPLCDILLAVPDKRTPIIQEVHLACEHLLCQLADYHLFENPAELARVIGEK